MKGINESMNERLFRSEGEGRRKADQKMGAGTRQFGRNPTMTELSAVDAHNIHLACRTRGGRSQQRLLNGLEERTYQEKHVARSTGTKKKPVHSTGFTGRRFAARSRQFVTLLPLLFCVFFNSNRGSSYMSAERPRRRGWPRLFRLFNMLT